MQVDHILILAAGKGTRMGEIGRVLPKLLWPIFGTSLLELQIKYAKRLAPGASVYVNAYHYVDKIQKFFTEKNLDKEARLVVEEEVLDIGGAIHNLAQQLEYRGNLLILNGDQFLMFDPGLLHNMLENLSQYNNILLGYKVNSNQAYNALAVNSNEVFTGVTKNDLIPRNTEMMTYTGTSLINLAQLQPITGESKFFDSVAVNNGKTLVTSINDIEYWDFGTLGRYHKSHFDLLQSRKSEFYDFLLSTNSFDPKLHLSANSYGSKQGINLTESEEREIFSQDICIGSSRSSLDPSEKPRIIYKDIIETDFL